MDWTCSYLSELYYIGFLNINSNGMKNRLAGKSLATATSFDLEK